MKRLLLISYYFPPDGGAGTQRAAKFCKYLPQFGWQPTVITRAHKLRSIWNPEDLSLAEELSGIEIVRAADQSTPSEWAENCPDIDIARNWLDSAWNAVHDICDRQRPDAALITMSPFD